MLKWPLGQELQQIRADLGLVRTQIILCKAAVGNISSVYVGTCQSCACKAARCQKCAHPDARAELFFFIITP